MRRACIGDWRGRERGARDGEDVARERKKERRSRRRWLCVCELAAT